MQYATVVDGDQPKRSNVSVTFGGLNDEELQRVAAIGLRAHGFRNLAADEVMTLATITRMEEFRREDGSCDAQPENRIKPKAYNRQRRSRFGHGFTSMPRFGSLTSDYAVVHKEWTSGQRISREPLVGFAESGPDRIVLICSTKTVSS
jgi:hypothetical protein